MIKREQKVGTLRAKKHWFWRRSSRRTAIISSLRRRLNLEWNSWSNEGWSFWARFNACTVWIASMLRFLPFCNGFRFLLLLLIPTTTHRVLPFANSTVLDGELQRVKHGARIAHELISLLSLFSSFQSRRLKQRVNSENGSRLGFLVICPKLYYIYNSNYY